MVIACVEVEQVVPERRLGRTAILRTAHANVLKVYLLATIQTNGVNPTVACVELHQVVLVYQLDRIAMSELAHANVPQVYLLAHRAWCVEAVPALVSQ